MILRLIHTIHLWWFDLSYLIAGLKLFCILISHFSCQGHVSSLGVCQLGLFFRKRRCMCLSRIHWSRSMSFRVSPKAQCLAIFCRAVRDTDTESSYRWHWVLNSSCLIIGWGFGLKWAVTRSTSSWNVYTWGVFGSDGDLMTRYALHAIPLNKIALLLAISVILFARK